MKNGKQGIKPINKETVAVIAVLLTIAVLSVGFCFITYEHPVVFLGTDLYRQYEEACIRYSHTLMFGLFGIPAHAQFVEIRETGYGIEILMISVLPPARTKVYHSEADAPYWTTGWNAY